jgi:hypothetical protein
MAYLIVNEFDGGTREQYDAVVKVVHESFRDETLMPGFGQAEGGFAGPPRVTEAEVEVDLT